MGRIAGLTPLISPHTCMVEQVIERNFRNIQFQLNQLDRSGIDGPLATRLATIEAAIASAGSAVAPNYAGLVTDTVIPPTSSGVITTGWNNMPDAISASDAATPKITVGETGDYEIFGSLSLFWSSGTATTATFQARINGTRHEIDKGPLLSTSDPNHLKLVGKLIRTLTAGWIIEPYLSLTSSPVLGGRNGQLTIKRIG